MNEALYIAQVLNGVLCLARRIFRSAPITGIDIGFGVALKQSHQFFQGFVIIPPDCGPLQPQRMFWVLWPARPEKDHLCDFANGFRVTQSCGLLERCAR